MIFNRPKKKIDDIIAALQDIADELQRIRLVMEKVAEG